MRRPQVGGYQGPVLVLTPGGEEVARAACRYRAEEDADGVDRWKGQLHRIIPADTVRSGEYRLRFPEGEEGSVTVAVTVPGYEVVYFEGRGQRPLAPP